MGLETGVDELAAQLLQRHAVPAQALIDAIHIAVAAVHRMEYLLTWNCTHIANAAVGGKIEEQSRPQQGRPPNPGLHDGGWRDHGPPRLKPNVSRIYLSMTLEDLVVYASECGLANAAWLRLLARPAVALTPVGLAGASSRGTTLGGRPTLPSGVMWPRHDGQSLAFIARIDMAEQPKFLAEQGFPAEGLLLFFSDAEQRTWGFDPKDAGTFAVIYVPDSSTATIAADWPPDLPEHARYPSCDLAGREVWALPPWESALVDDLQLAPEQLDAYQNLLERISNDDAWASRALLGGYPAQIQGDMMLECALVSAGLYCGDSTAYGDPRVLQLRAAAREWRLLLQVPSADAAGMMWGDLGCLYFWIRGDDLEVRRFDQAWDDFAVELRRGLPRRWPDQRWPQGPLDAHGL